MTNVATAVNYSSPGGSSSGLGSGSGGGSVPPGDGGGGPPGTAVQNFRHMIV